MRRRPSPVRAPRRSSVEWGVRIALALGAVVLAHAAVTRAIAYTMRAGATERAHALAPDDGRISALLSEQLAGPEATPAERVRADALARIALRQDPTAVSAVATLGINAAIRGDTPAARRFFAQADVLSRRDLRTRLWSIEDAVSRNDISSALRNYDIALRTSRIAPDLLFPVLAGAITTPEIRTGLVRILATRPLWGSQWLTYSSGNGPDATATAALFADLEHAKVPITYDARSALLRRLVGQGAINAAWRYYASFTPGVDRRRSRDPQFRAHHAIPAPFDWTVIEDNGVSASIQRGQDGGIFDFSVASGIGGAILQQMQLLPAGRYAIKGAVTGIDPNEPARPYWRLACTNGREVGRIDLPAEGRFAGTFDVPAGCDTQYLTLVARPSTQVSGIAGQLTRAALTPVAR